MPSKRGNFVCSMFCGVAFVLYTVTITFLYVLQVNSTEKKAEYITTKCETYGCLQAATQIVSYIDENVDPCENFYNFANGRYIHDMIYDSEVDDSEIRIASIDDTVYKLMNNRIGSLLNLPKGSNEWRPIRLAKTFFQSCLNKQHIFESENKQLNQIFLLIGVWPIVDNKAWIKTKLSLSTLIDKVADLGFDMNSVFKFGIYEDPNNKTNRLLMIGNGNFGANIEDSEKIILTLERQVHIWDEETKQRIFREMPKVLSFEKEVMDPMFAQIHNVPDDVNQNTDRENWSDNFKCAGADDEDQNSYNKTTIRELRTLYPYLNWLNYINGMLPSGSQVTENEPILNLNTQLFSTLNKIYESPKGGERLLANYVVWHAMYELYKFDSEEIGWKSRRDYCSDLTSKKFPIPVTLLYSRKYFNESSRQSAVNLVEGIRHAFIDMLGNVTWMDSTTRTKAIEKAKNIQTHIGHSDKLFGSYELVEYYQNLRMKSDKFYENMLRLNSFHEEQELKTWRKPKDRSGWEKTAYDFRPNEANVYYIPSDNTMIFPIAIFHEKLFSVDRAHYINYAILGKTVGHEITHGFDGTGRKYDLNGNLVNWWNSKTRTEFCENSKCFVNQYSRYKDTKTQLKVNALKTLDENIADNGGIRAAYYAYQSWVKVNGPEKLVPVIKYNQNQLFWISYAQAGVGVFGEDSLRKQIQIDYHAPNEFRINGVVTNTREFARDFNCSAGTKMNPTKICRIW